MKKWPKDPKKVVGFEDICQPIRSAMKQAYKLIRINKDKNIKWTGFEQCEECLATDFHPNEKLKAKSLKFNEDDQDRDALDVIIGIAVQQGIEQGMRMQRGNLTVSSI